MKIPKIKIASVPKKDRIRDLPKLKKIAVSVNKMAQSYDTRHLKETAYNKLKDHLDQVSMKALEATISEKVLPKGSFFFYFTCQNPYISQNLKAYWNFLLRISF